MNKRKVIILSALLCILFLSEAYGATYSTTAKYTSISQGYKIRGRANWDYGTGRYSSRGEPIIETKPKDMFTHYYLTYVRSYVDNNYTVTQYYRPKQVDIATGITLWGSGFSTIVKSAGPR